ncbi:MAG: hypothetical protein KGQ59_10730 [Bdellovibrionales bacterium]|nr:hypothetical protein [Bdellovibrionales bacterium]
MFLSTLENLRCLNCQGVLEARDPEWVFNEHSRGDVLWGRVTCPACQSWYPILAGVLLYVSDVENALVQHIKGISRLVPDERIPAEHLAHFVEARESLTEDGFFDEGLEEDLEAERVNALYVMNHYLKAENVPSTGSGLIDQLVKDHWDHGPLEKSAQWILKHGSQRVLEFGSSVGGIAQRLGSFGTDKIQRYLGIDASFHSVALARHLALGAFYPHAIRIPGDLIQGPVSVFPQLPAPFWERSDRADFILGDIHSLALTPERFDVCVALGLIDMLEEPGVLVYQQREALSPDGFAIQASPYIWHEQIAAALRDRYPGQSSAEAVLSLYQDSGFKIYETEDSLPWVFYKHQRQVELYSVHLSIIKKNSL